MNSHLKYHLPVIIFCLVIFIESSIPSDAFPILEFEWSDKIIHFLIYLVLFFTFNFSFSNQDKFFLIKMHSLSASLFFTALYGATDEIHQFFVPGRTCDIYDWIADVFGAVFALFILLLLKKYSGTKNNSIKPVL